MPLSELTDKLLCARNLQSREAAEAAVALADERVGDPAKMAFLLALHEKGETAAEVAALAGAFRGLARDGEVDEWAPRAIDVCGTGGDGAGTFNISTTVAFMLAASGVPVFKHGNRSITSKSGSSQLLEALGLPVESEPEALRASLRELSFAFFFAPAFHPAFKAIMPVRRALAEEGKRTVFNILGPLLNPGRPHSQLLGVFSEEWVERLAGALGELGLRRGLVVHGILPNGGRLDELSCAGENVVRGFGELAGLQERWQPEDLGLRRCAVEELAGGTPEENVALLSEIARGGGTPGLRDTLCLNAGAAFWAAGAEADLAAGLSRARSVLDEGLLRDWLEKARAFTV